MGCNAHDDIGFGSWNCGRIHDELSVCVPLGDPEQPVGDEPPAGVAGHNTFPGSAACNVVRIEESRSRCPRRSPGGMIGARMR